jgi:hypothetical protein
VNTILVSDQTPVIELHQFAGVTDNSEDPYNIDWQNTREDKSTEILAFSQENHSIPTLILRSEIVQSTLENVLNIIKNIDVV